MSNFKEAMIKAGLTNEFLLKRTEEFIEAIKNGTYKPRNKRKVLNRILNMRKVLIYRIKNNLE